MNYNCKIFTFEKYLRRALTMHKTFYFSLFLTAPNQTNDGNSDRGKIYLAKLNQDCDGYESGDHCDLYDLDLTGGQGQGCKS